MSEILEEQPAKQFDIRHYMDIVRRRHLQFLIPLFLGWLAVWGASWVIPARYTSSTLILVEQPTMPKDYVTPNINEDLQDTLQSITQQILSRTRLMLIIDRLKLYDDGRHELTTDKKIDRMREDIDVELVRDATHENQITAFNIDYSAYDPNVAQQVTRELTNLFINANLQVRQQESEDTTKFLESQLNNARMTLSDQEARVREFQAEHIGELPDQQASNLQILSGLQSQLTSEQDALNTAQQQHVYLQTLINQYKAMQMTTHASGAAPTRLPVIDEQLDKLKSQLTDLSSRYTDSYPDVVKVKKEIAKTEKMRADLIANLSKAAKSTDEESDTRNEIVDSVQNAPLAQLQSQLQANQAEVANRQQSIASLKNKIDGYQSRLNTEPVRQQELADLTRGYEQSKANYDELLKKKNDSEMATSMERLQQGERFIMLDPPSLPTKPAFPNRLKFCGIGLAVGLALGVVLVGGLEFLDDRLHSDKEIANLLPLAIISEIPEIVTPLDERHNRRKMLLGWATGALVVAIILAGSAFSYLHT